MSSTLSVAVESPVAGTLQAWARVPEEPGPQRRAELMARCTELLR